MKKLHIRILCLLIVLPMLFFAAIPVFATNSIKEGQVVKVGYMDHPGFIEKDENNRYFGYGVEYLDEICRYTGWKVEYVHAAWSEQLEMLERGEIDIVPMAQYSQERAEKFYYTNHSIGIIQCLLLSLPEEQNDIDKDARDYDGKTIGIMRGSRNIDLLKKYANDMEFDYKQVEYAYQSELEDALVKGEVDIIACEQMIGKGNFQILDRFASDPYYFITNKDNGALMEELNYVISKLNAYDPVYTSKLYQKYYGESVVSNSPYFTTEEIEFIKSCDGVTIALIPGTKPESYEDEDGNLTGIVPDIMNQISKLSGISFSYTFIPNNISPIEYLKENPDCFVSGVVSSNPAFRNEDMLLSDVYQTTYSALATHTDMAKRIVQGTSEQYAPNKGNYTVGTTQSFQAMHLFLQKNYPYLTVKDYLTAEDGLKALEDKEVDYFAYISNIITPYLANPVYGDIVIVDSFFMENPRCIVGMNNSENKIFIDIMNKCISMISEETVAQIENKHIQQSIYHYDSSDTFHRYQDALMLTALVAVGAFALLVTLLLIRQRKYTRDITHHAEYDMMTGVYNRATCQKKAQELMEQNIGKGCVLLIIDIDDLKRINDTRGHVVGDDAVKSMASILKQQFRGSAVIGRIGGDEFAVGLCGIKSKAILVPMLVRLQKEISLVDIANGTAVLGASIGVAMGIAGKDDIDSLYHCAEEAMNRVKQNSKNGFAFYESNKWISLNEISKSKQTEDKEEISAKSLWDDKELSSRELQCDNVEIVNNTDDNYRKLFDAFANVSVYVIERETHKVLFFNRRFREICPNIQMGMSCRNLMLGPCQNCIVDTMGEQNMAHTIFYSDYFGDEMEITAYKIMWEDSVPAVMICSWPHNVLTSSNDSLPSASNQDTFDYVTGGLSRRGFIHMIERMQMGGVDLTEYAILFINVKDFKAVNEMVGCDGGDNLLRTIFTRVEQSYLHPVIGARKESDHFIFMVEKSELELSMLPELMNFHWTYHDKDLFVHCRCGIFNIDDNDLEVYKMIDRAKLAKKHIVDDYVQPYAIYNQSMLEEYSENASAFLLFDNGIKNNEFVVFYQPVIDAATGKVASAEALVRRKTSDGTIISPGKFIPILERSGYISMLDRFVATEVYKFLNKRQKKNMPIVPVSFNVSQKDFYDASLMELLASNLEASILPKGFLMIEITESAYTLNEKKHEEYLKRLRDAGAKILLDDFGTGYSSFGMFENYNFDRVKLDMSFVRQLRNNENVRHVVESIISMCHKLNVQVVAEGVETEEELSILRDMNCDFIQGYYFSKPLDEKSFVKYLEGN